MTKDTANSATEKVTVGFLSPKGSYTHQATTSLFPESQYEVKPQITISDVFACVQDSSCTYGVVPFENSSNGSVVPTLDLFADRQGQNGDILVCDEIYLRINHCLVGSRQPGGVEDGLARITKLYSHPQAWGQCTVFLTKHFKGTERIDVSSTSKAAQIVAEDESATSAAICSRMAAEMFGGEVLREGIEDRDDNFTRFLVLKRNGGIDSEQPSNGDGFVEDAWKSMVTFTVEHGEPGALADCLAVFKKHHLNLTSINSRPSGDAPWHYIFFVEFLGRRMEDGKGGAVNDALTELEGVAKSCRFLGSWENALKK